MCSPGWKNSTDYTSKVKPSRVQPSESDWRQPEGSQLGAIGAQDLAPLEPEPFFSAAQPVNESTAITPQDASVSQLAVAVSEFKANQCPELRTMSVWTLATDQV